MAYLCLIVLFANVPFIFVSSKFWFPQERTYNRLTQASLARQRNVVYFTAWHYDYPGTLVPNSRGNKAVANLRLYHDPHKVIVLVTASNPNYHLLYKDAGICAVSWPANPSLSLNWLVMVTSVFTAIRGTGKFTSSQLEDSTKNDPDWVCRESSLLHSPFLNS